MKKDEREDGNVGFIFELKEAPKVNGSKHPVPHPQIVLPQPQPNKIDWTIMVYLGGDNNLAEEMVYALKSMLAVGSTSRCQVYALYDAGLEPIAFKIPTRDGLSELRRHTIKLRELEENGDRKDRFSGPLTENTGIFELAAPFRQNRPKVEPVQTTLETFMKRAIKDSPAHSYALVLSGHGSGSVTDFLGARKRFSGLTIQDLGETLRNVAEHFRGRKIYDRLNLLGMDSCQMSTGEVASEIVEHVDFLIGAEGFEPNTGWPYDLIIARLNQETSKHNGPAAAIARLEKVRRDVAEGSVREYIKFYASDYTIAEISTDISAINLKAFKNVTELLARRREGLVDLMRDTLKGPKAKARLSPDGSAIILAHWEAQGYKSEQNVDLWDFCECLQSRSERFRPICRQIQRAIDELVVCSGYCGPAFQHSHGLSVYFPWCESIDAAGISDIQHYKTLEFAAASRWGDFLEVYTQYTQRPFRKTEGAGSSFTSALNRRDGFFTGDPFALDGALKIDLAITGINYPALDFRTEQPMKLNPVNFVVRINDGKLGGRRISDTELLVERAELSIPDGKLTLRDARTLGENSSRINAERLSITKGSFQDLDDEKLDVQGTLNLMGQVVLVDRDKLAVARGKVCVERGVLKLSGSDIRADKLCLGGLTLAVRKGRLTVEQGMLLTDEGEPRHTVGAAELRVRNERIMAEQELGFFSDRLISRNEKDSFRNEKDSFRTEKDSFRNEKDSFRTEKDSFRNEKDSFRSEKDSFRGTGGGGLVKIESMKNPPVNWAECDLISKRQPQEAPKHLKAKGHAGRG
jgi:hypothetical protein